MITCRVTILEGEGIWKQNAQESIWTKQWWSEWCVEDIAWGQTSVIIRITWYCYGSEFEEVKIGWTRG